MSRPIGLVVAGLGRAGRARVRDIKGNVLGENVAHLVGVISRHNPDDIDVPFLSWDEALSKNDVSGVIICTESGTHEEYSRKCLDAGKHVLVEFPATISFASTKSLIELASTKDVIFQEEDIGLLTPAFKELMEMIKSKPSMVEASMTFTADLNSSFWISDFSRAGFPSFSGVNRLHMIYELFGEMTVKEAVLTENSDKKEMIATVLTKTSRPILWTESRTTGSNRSFTFHFKFEDGTTMDYSPRMGPPPRTAAASPGQPPADEPRKPRGLFARDLDLFLQKIRGEISAEEIEREFKRTLHCSEVAGKIEEMATKEVEFKWLSI